MTATSFILNLSSKMPLFSWSVGFFLFLGKDFSWVSVMQELSRCVWVLIRCGEPVLLFACEQGTKGRIQIVQVPWTTNTSLCLYFAFSIWCSSKTTGKCCLLTSERCGVNTRGGSWFLGGGELLRCDCLADSHAIRYLMSGYKFFVAASQPGGEQHQVLPKLQY